MTHTYEPYWKLPHLLLLAIFSLTAAAQRGPRTTSQWPLSGPTGTMDFQVRDSLTHHPIRATIKGIGFRTFSITTDPKGNAKMDLPVGEYRLEMSASGYAALTTHYNVEPGKITSAGAFLDPLTTPEEETRANLDPLLRPGYTLLHEYVVDAETGEPVLGVTVRFVNAAVEARTDANGHFQLLLPTPKPETPDGMGTDTLIYEKSGYKTLVLRNFGVAPEEMGPSAIEMERGRGKIDRDATHKLMRKRSGEFLQPQPTEPL